MAWLLGNAARSCSPALNSVLNEESQTLSSLPGDHATNHPPMCRLAAYDDEELVGWSIGHMERSRLFFRANSGVIASRRRQGIYTSLLDAVCSLAKSEGAVGLRSQHSVVNNPVLIAKLRYGFHISGISNSVHMGALVELTHHFSIARQEMYRSRVIPYVPGQQKKAGRNRLS
ncbi:MAG: GNAT family N-acetyltransferase [Rhodoferax sp.]